jgi:hypothetical protein
VASFWLAEPTRKEEKMQRSGSRRPRDWSGKHHHGKALAIGPGRTAHRRRKRLTGHGREAKAARQFVRQIGEWEIGEGLREAFEELLDAIWAGEIPEEIPQPFIEPLKRMGLLQEVEGPDGARVLAIRLPED